MASVVISGDTSGSVTLSAPTVAGSSTLTLPAFTGTAMAVGTLTNVTASRVLGTTYTNSTGTAIFVSVYVVSGTSAGSISAVIDGLEIARQGISAGANCTCRINVTFLVPNGSTYSSSIVSGSGALAAWSEIR